MSMTRSAELLAGLVLALVLTSACSNLPTEGEVRTRPDAAGEVSNQAPYFVPPGPTPGDDPEGVVRGFLLAMQANPPSTSVARRFLSDRARSAWKPVGGTIVYDGASVDSSGSNVFARLSDAHRLDATGTWDTGEPVGATTVPFTLVRQGSEWRIDNPPNALAVPASYFSSIFVPLHLYFFDQSGTVLVPTRVYLPRGKETATNLVRGLLAGPGSAMAGVVSTAFPKTDLELAVVVNDDGVAEVPLGAPVLRLSATDLNRVVVQLAWTLRQVPGITRIRITVDGATVPMPDGRSEVGILEGIEYDPLTAPAKEVVAIAGDRVVRIGPNDGSPIGGPLGAEGFALRSVAMDANRHQVAGVSANGRRVYQASDRGSRAAVNVRSVLEGATGVLRPVYDRFGGLWLVDATRNGAVVHLVVGNHSREVQIPGISGRRIGAFTVSRDGTRFVAAQSGGTAEGLLISALVRDQSGQLVRAEPASGARLGETAVGPIRDVAQSGATTLAVLTQTVDGPGRITFVEMDGSPGAPGTGTPDLVPGPLLGLAAGPDPDLALQVVTGGQVLLRLDRSGQWVRSPVAEVRAAAYPQ